MMGLANRPPGRWVPLTSGKNGPSVFFICCEMPALLPQRCVGGGGRPGWWNEGGRVSSGASSFAPESSSHAGEPWKRLCRCRGQTPKPLAAPRLKCQSLRLPPDRGIQESSAGCPRQLLRRNRDRCSTKLEFDGSEIMYLIRSCYRVLINP